MMHRRFVLAGLAALAASGARAQQQSREQIAAMVNGQPPATYYQAAITLFQAGRRDDAVFVFYLGQLRYRTHLAARPSLKPDGDPALFASLSETVGRPINEWAFGDISALLRTVDVVMAYDARDPDKFTPPTEFPDAHKRIRDGMASFRRQMEAQAQDIRRQRTANGLENR
jgi:hypothetical protein